MRTVDEHTMHAPAGVCFEVAADVESWPRILPHYRHVRFLERQGAGRGRVEMAAWRDFGPGTVARWPTWWVSDMRAEPDEPAIYYRHVDGITRGMDVRWEFAPAGQETRVRIVHQWSGPGWPLIGRFAADTVIGPAFISAIARRTLAGVAAEAERRARLGAA
ncbi:MAG TPA: SRPBCC family protein [Longimicrobiales bacterium]